MVGNLGGTSDNIANRGEGAEPGNGSSFARSKGGQWHRDPNFIGHRLAARTSRGETRAFALEPQTVAERPRLNQKRLSLARAQKKKKSAAKKKKQARKKATRRHRMR